MANARRHLIVCALTLARTAGVSAYTDARSEHSTKHTATVTAARRTSVDGCCDASLWNLSDKRLVDCLCTGMSCAQTNIEAIHRGIP
jgi:hypothetical protein